MGKRKRNYSEEFSWLKTLIKEDYKFMIMPKGNQKVFYATKDSNRMKNGKFYARSVWDEYKLIGDESWIPGKNTKGVYIDLKN